MQEISLLFQTGLLLNPADFQGFRVCLTLTISFIKCSYIVLYSCSILQKLFNDEKNYHLLPSSHSSRYTFSKITLPYERLLTWCWHNSRSGLKRSFIDPVRWNRRNNILIVQSYPLFKTSCYFPLTNVCLRL